MKINFLNRFVFLMSASVLLFSLSCKDTESPPSQPAVNPWDTVSNFKGLIIPADGGTINFQMNYTFNGSSIVFGSKQYSNAAGDTFTIKELKHYFTNITLKRADGSELNLQNYNLLDAATASTQNFTLTKIPAGNYVGMSVLLAVDSFRNHEGMQEGALDPGWGLFWTWSSGYIFYRINGTTTASQNYSFDLGGDNNAPKVTMDLSSYKVKSATPKITLLMDVNEMFQNPSNFSFKTDGYTIHSGLDAGAAKMSQNMKDMVTVTNLNP